MGSSFHAALDIRDALRQDKRAMAGAFRDASGQVLTPDEARDFLFDCLVKGWRVLPMTPVPCDGFSYETGCPGHPHPAAAEAPASEGSAASTTEVTT